MKRLYVIQKIHSLCQTCSKIVFAVSVTGVCLSFIALVSQKLPDNSLQAEEN